MFINRRRQIEESWWLRLQQAQTRYRTATAQYRRMLNQQPEGQTSSVDYSLLRAREAESQARAEYRRVLAIFTDLTLYGKIPEEQSTGGWAVQ